MTVSLPQANTSWLSSLANAFSPQHSQQMGGYFPPAPSAAGSPVAGAAAAPVASGGFLQRMLSQIPANQYGVNGALPNIRLGG